MLNEIAVGIIISLLFISLVVVFCAVLIRLYIKKISEHTQAEIQFQKTLTASILETQEQLLQSISQDLHDDAGQQLTVINFQLENLKLDNKENTQLEIVSSSVMQLSHSLRKISHSLNPNWLENIGLIKAISNECERINEQKRISIYTKIDNSSNRKLNKDVEIVVFRIFQESINNILKHAKASKIEILIETEQKLFITIKDNGQGFDVDNQKVSDSIGLKNCINRAQLINFDYEISSKINEGTIVVLSEK